jgi:cyclopropane fatty-acyl-phospholipid synthase-like methyltransferase/methyltransferase-like protein
MSKESSDPSSYDELPYESRFVATSHPDRLAAMATIFGLKPPDVAGCRVLELGCADGGNLITMAQTIPGGTFVGVELSSRQVADGQALIGKLGLTNVELRAMSLMALDDSLGTFDYIVCHGVYSWVSADVRARILEVCSRNLSADGVAFVSYNTYPGWHYRQMVREMVAFHASGLAVATEPKALVRETRALVDFLARSATPSDGVHARALRHEAELLGRSRDTYIFHEHLEPENYPVYFHEFATEAAAAGLRHFAPARFDIVESLLSPEVHQALGQLGPDRVRRDQYIDFVLNRTFRQSLLCHDSSRPSNDPLPEAVETLRLTALSRPEAQGQDVDIKSDVQVPFVTLFGDRLTVGHPLLKAALVALCERWPRSSGFDELWSEARARLGRQGPAPAAGDERRAFATFLVQGNMLNLVNLHAYDPPIAAEAGPRPAAPPLIRHQSLTGRVTTLRLCSVPLDSLDRCIVPLLDGTRDRAAIVEALAALTAAGTLQIQEKCQPVRDPQRARFLLADHVERSLAKLASEALLMTSG